MSVTVPTPPACLRRIYSSLSDSEPPRSPYRRWSNSLCTPIAAGSRTTPGVAGVVGPTSTFRVTTGTATGLAAKGAASVDLHSRSLL